ncbi:MAG: FAD-binding oxidoreductase, partial [Vicinamibacterales bacterium]
AVVDPFLLTQGLATAAVAQGAVLFERSPVTKTAASKDGCVVTLAAARVRAQHVVIATGVVPSWLRPLARHVRRRSTFTVQTEPVPATLRKVLGTRDHLLRELAEPAHRIWWSADHRLFVSGADADDLPANSREARLVQRTGQLMYELSTFYPEISGLRAAYGWDAMYSATPLGLPIAGPHRNYPHHAFAFGDTSRSVTGAWLASRVLLRQCTGDVLPDDALLGFAR